MSSSISLSFSISPSFSPHRHSNPSSFSLRHSHFLTHNPLCGLHTLPSLRRTRNTAPQTLPARVVISAVQSNFFKVLQTALRVGKDGIEAGTNLVPDVVPRPIARIGIAVVILTVSLFVLKSLLSTAFFVLAMMGLIYFVYITLNKDEGPGGGGGTGAGATEEETLEEARRIMEKYK
ncbi:uncharacterized protein LOC131245686 [Magnolia sinica]|uniref:uncharacterized protein LOC131245686 n=1 Tax=Magnolia sinica TaxID=86752 RepID=UPI002658D927|nr:uncharacterized protein LOC131245686 [Magnolia sinica]XP_058101278.1 uncharacterized protein LOC131245686 [Magnolia sinica]XP_058101279.1 uncharacterized protein LOC131245686 [Magnolia sinica]